MAPVDLSKLRIERGAAGAVPPRGRALRKLVFTALIVVAAGAAAFLLYRSIAGAAVAVEQATVTLAYPYQAITVLNATGYVVAQRKASVASKATGRLEWLGVQEGSRVRKGEIIARLEREDVAAARDQAAANVRVAQANLEQAEAELREARRALDRSRDLLEKSFVSQASHDEVLGRFDRAQAAVNSARAGVRAAEANRRAAEVAVEQTVIRAPFDGVVLTKNANVGDTITPFSSALDTKGAVVTMADMSTLEVEADVSESNLEKVRPDQPCVIDLDALPSVRFDGFVARMVPTVDRTKATVMTKIRFRELDPRILPDMSAKVAFLSRALRPEERTPRPAVDAQSVVTRNGQQVVFVVEDGKAIRTPVRTGERLGDLVQLEEGPETGVKVVLRPSDKLANGAAVKPLRR